MTEASEDGVVVAERPKTGGSRIGFGALRSREFALFWSGQAISQTGTWMQQFAQGWVVATLASSAFALASVNLAASIPILFLTPFGGSLRTEWTGAASCSLLKQC